MNDPTTLHPADLEFVERVGRLFEADAAPRIAGRIMGLLMLSPQAMALEEIAAELRVSKASVSTNAREMERWGVLERVTRGGDRRDFYQVATDLATRMLERRLARLREVEALLGAGDALPALRDERIRRRFQVMERLHHGAIASLEETLRALRDIHCEAQAQTEGAGAGNGDREVQGDNGAASGMAGGAPLSTR